MKHPWKGLGNLPRGVWILFVTTLINRLGTMALPFLVLYLTRSRGFTAGEAGFVVSIYGFTAILAGPTAGRLCDRIGTLRVLQASLFLSGLAVMAYPLGRGRGSIFALTIAWAFTNEAFRPANLSMYSEVAGPSQRRAAFAVARLAVNLGMSVGPAAGGFLAMVSFPALFIVNGATSIVAGAALTLWSRELREAGERFRPSPDERARTDAAPWSAYADRRMLYFLAALLPVMLVFFQHEAAMSLFLVRDLGLPESSFGLLFTINTLLIIFLEVPLNLRMSDWPHGRALALGAFLVGAGFGAMALASGFWSAVMTVVIWTFGEMILLPTSSAYAAEIAPPDLRGSYMGLYTTSFSVAFAIGPWLGTATLDRRGPIVLWGAAFLFGCVSAAMMARIRFGTSHAADEPPAPVLPPSGEAL
ncbi:MAG TPA: MFS transporter [Candidatus Polarisedimenticolia bacterium]|nr:MFS transporter [Candidatus Polarisedimenticolia bacterium]